ncbi:MAG: dnaE2 [Brevundimonas sp.]|nr:dnaE2 [Brevundimonas sp.]
MLNLPFERETYWLASVGGRDAPLKLHQGRGDEFAHGGAPDARDAPPKGMAARDIYIPDRHIDSIKPKTWDFGWTALRAPLEGTAGAAFCSDGMTRLLQDKDSQWRDRPNGATPVFDPGLSALGTDDEAGGARAPAAANLDDPAVTPMPATPVSHRHAPRLKPSFWWTVVALVVAALVITAIASLT